MYLYVATYILLLAYFFDMCHRQENKWYPPPKGVYLPISKLHSIITVAIAASKWGSKHFWGVPKVDGTMYIGHNFFLYFQEMLQLTEQTTNNKNDALQAP